jgi:hypothetical protein
MTSRVERARSDAHVVKAVFPPIFSEQSIVPTHSERNS